jgi:hypothetical protein
MSRWCSPRGSSARRRCARPGCRAGCGAVEYFRAGVLLWVGGDLGGWWMLSLSQVTVITGARGNARSTWSGGAVKSAARRRPSRYTRCPVVTSGGPGHGDLLVRARGEHLRAGAAQRPAGPGMRRQVQVGLVLGEHHRPARQLRQPGHDRGGHVIMVRVAAGDQLRPPPGRRQPDPPVQRPRADLPPPQVPPDPGQGPAARDGASGAAIRPASRCPPGRGRPGRGRPAGPASPSRLNRLIRRRTVAGWQSGSAAIWAGGYPCSDSSTITAQVACRRRPCRSSRSCPVSVPGPSANTLTGRILITTSPAGRTMPATSIQPPARLMPASGSCRPHSGYAQNSPLGSRS